MSGNDSRVRFVLHSLVVAMLSACLSWCGVDALAQTAPDDLPGSSSPPSTPSAPAGAVPLTTNGPEYWSAISVGGEADWYVLSIPSQVDGPVTIETRLGTLADTVLELYDSNLTLVASDDDSGEGYASRLSGPYKGAYARVRAYASYQTGTYSIRVSVGGTQVTYTQITVNGASVQGNLQPEQYGWFFFDVTAAGNYGIETSLGSLRDTVIYLYGPGDPSRLIASDDDSGEGYASKLVTSLSNGRYYVKVTGYSRTQSGSYSIRVYASSSPAVRDLVVGASAIWDAIETAGSYDWFRLSITTAGYYGIRVTHGTLPDSYLELYNSSGSRLAYDDDSGENYQAFIQDIYLSPGTYYVKVRAYSSRQTGTYRVGAGAGSPPRDPSAPSAGEPTPDAQPAS